MSMLSDRFVKVRYGLLFDGYRYELWWYEIVICIRKVTLILIPFMIENGRIQLHVTLLLFLLYVTANLYLRPFPTQKIRRDGSIDNRWEVLYKLDMCSLLVLSMTLWMSAFLFSDFVRDPNREYGEADNEDTGRSTAVGVIAVVVNVVIVMWGLQAYVTNFCIERRMQLVQMFERRRSRKRSKSKSASVDGTENPTFSGMVPSEAPEERKEAMLNDIIKNLQKPTEEDDVEMQRNISVNPLQENAKKSPSSRKKNSEHRKTSSLSAMEVYRKTDRREKREGGKKSRSSRTRSRPSSTSKSKAKKSRSRSKSKSKSMSKSMANRSRSRSKSQSAMEEKGFEGSDLPPSSSRKTKRNS